MPVVQERPSSRGPKTFSKTEQQPAARVVPKQHASILAVMEDRAAGDGGRCGCGCLGAEGVHRIHVRPRVDDSCKPLTGRASASGLVIVLESLFIETQHCFAFPEGHVFVVVIVPVVDIAADGSIGGWLTSSGGVVPCRLLLATGTAAARATRSKQNRPKGERIASMRVLSEKDRRR